MRSRCLCAGCHAVGKQVPSALIPACSQPQVLTSSNIYFRHLISSSLAFVSITTHLTYRLRLFLIRSRPKLFTSATLRRFAITSCKATAEGLPPSHGQHVLISQVFRTHWLPSILVILAFTGCSISLGPVFSSHSDNFEGESGLYLKAS